MSFPSNRYDVLELIIAITVVCPAAARTSGPVVKKFHVVLRQLDKFSTSYPSANR